MTTRRLSFDIPQKIIDEAASGELAKAHRRIASLEKKVRELESREANAKRAIAAFQGLRVYLADQFDLYEDHGL